MYSDPDSTWFGDEIQRRLKSSAIDVFARKGVWCWIAWRSWEEKPIAGGIESDKEAAIQKATEALGAEPASVLFMTNVTAFRYLARNKLAPPLPEYRRP